MLTSCTVAAGDNGEMKSLPKQMVSEETDVVVVVNDTDAGGGHRKTRCAFPRGEALLVGRVMLMIQAR